MWNEPTPTSGFPRSLMSYVQQANDLGNPLGGVCSFHMIHIGFKAIPQKNENADAWVSTFFASNESYLD